jgi:hypothetical protein
VKILTREEIPVDFYSNDMGDSMTDGKGIIISSTINSNNVDSVVGLALHESAHCRYTDFSYVKKLANHLLSDNLMMGKDMIHLLMNFVEDRRIDSLVYKTAPGYQGYYNSMYERYYYNSTVDKGLSGTEYRQENWEAYLFRIINIFNSNSDMDALAKLREIYDIIDLKNIDRLKNTQESFEVAKEMYILLAAHFRSLPPAERKNQNIKNQKKGEKNSISKEEIKKSFRKQEEFLKGNVYKNPTTRKQKSQIEAISKSNISVRDVNIEGKRETKYKVHVIKGISNTALKSKLYGVFNPQSWKEQEINKGISLGKKLHSKLRIRNEQITLESTRLRKGKIDARRVYAAGFVEDIFKKTNRSTYKPINLHVSIDGSGSMEGEKWDNTLINTVALGYIALKMDNINLNISVRTSGRMDQKTNIPLLVLAFDSKKHTLSDLKKLGHLKTNGLTPEGICLESLNDFIPASSYYLDSYLINMSDGWPMFENGKGDHYTGQEAINHTAKVVQNMRKKGVNILSYFISTKGITEYKNQEIVEGFKTMYGKGASFIDPKNINEVTKTLNKLFLTKNMIS